MPGVDGRSERIRLFAVGGMTEKIVKLAVGGGGADIEFIHRISDTISWVGGTVGVAGVGRVRHQDANEADRDKLIRQMNGLDATFSGFDLTMRKRQPDSLGGAAEGISSGPVLDKVTGGIGRGPVDPEGVNILVIAKVDDRPLGMHGVRFPSESAGEIRVTFPVGRGVAVGQARIAGAAVISAMGKGVTVGISNETGRGRRAGEVALLLAGVAPGAGGIPMPCLDLQVSVLAIGDWLPSGGENLIGGCRVVQGLVDGVGGDAIDARAQGLAGNKAIGGVPGSDVDVDSLGARDPGRNRGRKNCQ